MKKALLVLAMAVAPFSVLAMQKQEEKIQQTSTELSPAETVLLDSFILCKGESGAKEALENFQAYIETVDLVDASLLQLYLKFIKALDPLYSNLWCVGFEHHRLIYETLIEDIAEILFKMNNRESFVLGDFINTFNECRSLLTHRLTVHLFNHMTENFHRFGKLKSQRKLEVFSAFVILFLPFYMKSAHAYYLFIKQADLFWTELSLVSDFIAILDLATRKLNVSEPTLFKRSVLTQKAINERVTAENRALSSVMRGCNHVIDWSEIEAAFTEGHSVKAKSV